MKRYLHYIIFVTSIFLLSQSTVAQLPTLNKELNGATVIVSNSRIVVSTGRFSRTWQLTDAGLATVSVKDIDANKEWAEEKLKQCDWTYNGLIDNNTKAKLLRLTATESNDSGFTSAHLLVEAEFEYPAVETFLKYSIRVYPNVSGVFTQLAIKGRGAASVKAKPVTQEINFKLNSGKNAFNYKASEQLSGVFADYVSDSVAVEYLVTGLNKSLPYKLALSWLDITNMGTAQKVIVSSVDGEFSGEVLKPETVPSFQKQEKPALVIFDIPQHVMHDGSFRFTITKTTGHAAVLSEAWLMSTHHKGQPAFAGDMERVHEIQDRYVSADWKLVAYHNAGNTSGNEAQFVSGRVDFLPVNAAHLRRKYAGYFNDTQHRNKKSTPLLHEEVKQERIVEPEKVGWASVLVVQEEDASLIVVKESHKCVNQYGHDTGEFEVSELGISNTGTSLFSNEILTDRYRNAWASWVICSGSSGEEEQLALKEFERQRFPVNTKTDVYMIANTWGSDRAGEATNEANILLELKTQNYLGIDVQQIDAGYQSPAGKKTWNNAGPGGWYPHPDRYPQGFKNVKDSAAFYKMKLGLWFPAMQVSLEEMKNNYDEGNFACYKLDFANLNNHNALEAMLLKIRNYELYTGHRSKVNWDVTENAPRFGYFWAKEYGAVFLENRKPKFPVNVVYTPYLVLRDLWHLSKYCNLNKFQGSVQNKDMVDRESSDAYRHEHAYTAAIPLMATPLFFQETHFYTQPARNEIKTVLSAYRRYRDELYQCYVFPIGQEPDNSSWTGFQAVHPNDKKGFVHLFREIESVEPVQNITLYFLKNKAVRLTNMLTGETLIKKADSNGRLEFEMHQPGSFLLFHYNYE